ncbi:TetR/AcrR family transcriptional regulator [Actinoallomurus rhizosphaericola]|uniref:TetR/AcrR family transcriptional regulator n=1 Tax=Actinoallomurus rhizosphaericola TaxID=2952536 RepID=UPI0020924B53|nr:TetR/AcrR family transcriptional regulator [Actinoallomurus rhizosphaericola]MCO6000000.1 TetR/AcrR family transcriptional regulator [Actinoallomurus rhizosphaericola]
MSEAIDWTPKAHAVLQAASELFYEHGIHAVGVDVIAKRAGVTKKTLYDRFGSKDRLVVEYLTERDNRWRGFLDAHLARADPSPRAQIAAVFDASAAWARERGRKGCSMINAHAEISDPAHPAYSVIVGQKRRMLALFTELATAAGVADPRQAGEQIMLLHEGAVVTAGMHAIEDAFTSAAAAASALLG